MQKKISLKKQFQTAATLKIVDNKYIIKNLLLGTGSFSKTYIALQQNKQAVLACKMISKMDLIDRIKKSQNKNFVKQYYLSALKNQITTWKNLKHKNIVKFYEFSQTSKNFYIFLQYCKDGNLECLLKNGRLNQKQAACQYLYDNSIFHRDLKPENILIHQRTIKIADFGFAKVFQNESKDSPQLRTSVGTPIYMAPQVLQGSPYTIKCDVWSLGVVFYRMIYGFLPWEYTENHNILISQIRGGCKFPESIKINQELKQLISLMLTIQQQSRISIKQAKGIVKKIMNRQAMSIENQY